MAKKKKLKIGSFPQKNIGIKINNLTSKTEQLIQR
tara:strand:+ start:1034 stop:1138 length:105 start_codon:yes stop_codon:yes gene_type:complete